MRTPLPENREKVVAALKVKPMSIPEISAIAGVSPPCARGVVHMLQNDGQCFIERWEIREESYSRTAIYALGKGVDAKRPAARPAREHCRRYKEKLLENICTADEIKMSERLRLELSRPAFRHPFDVWLFGPVKAPSKPAALPVRTFQQDMTITKDELEEV